MDDNDGRLRQVRCPFGIRDLSTDECYSGMGRNRCKFFERYAHEWTDDYSGKCRSYIVCRGTVDMLQQEILFDWNL